jgi:hypothetical protein
MANGNGKGHHSLEAVNLEDIVLYIASQNPENAYFRSDALAYAFDKASKDYPKLIKLFERGEPIVLRTILDVKKHAYLVEGGSRYIEFHIKQEYPTYIQELSKLSDRIWQDSLEYQRR